VCDVVMIGGDIWLVLAMVFGMFLLLRDFDLKRADDWLFALMVLPPMVFAIWLAVADGIGRM